MTALILTVVVAVSSIPQTPPTADIRSRLDAYEKAGRDDPATLAAIARDVLGKARRSPTYRVWSEACAVTLAPDSEGCERRLWAVLNRTSETLATRAEAASALMARGDTNAAETLYTLLNAAPAATLAPLAAIVAEMPAKRAVGLLVRLANSPSAAHGVAACKALSRFDVPESHAALAGVVERSAPGTEPWLYCMIARARLREPSPPGLLWGYGHTLQGQGQIFAAQVMLEVGQDPVQLLTDLTHRGGMADRLAAAELLIRRNPDAAIPVIEAAQADGDSKVRAAAVAAERLLNRAPSKNVRARLLDTAEIVQIRAAETILAWERQQKR